jgi:cytochrome c oxidase subunit 2
MLAVGTLVLVAVLAIGWLAMGRQRALPEAQARRDGQRWIVGGGIVLPAVVITALLVFGSSAGLHQLPLPGQWGRQGAGEPGGGAANLPPLRVDVTGHQWWWELHYPGSGARLRNEMRMPVGRAVDVHVGSADVIHSFWVPRLGGKLDAVPGRTQVVRLQADQPGIYRGQCAEFCGLAHAHMTMTVVAMPLDEFEAWLGAQRAPAASALPPAQAAPPAPVVQPVKPAQATPADRPPR